MVSVPCPLRTCDEVHEVRLDRSGNQFIACKSWRNSIWFRGVGESYLNSNNGGGSSIHAIENNPAESDGPSVFEERAARSGLVGSAGIERPRRTWPCPMCGTPVPEDSPRCPGCGDEIRWESGEAVENPADADRQVEQRQHGRVEGDVARLLRKIERGE